VLIRDEIKKNPISAYLSISDRIDPAGAYRSLPGEKRSAPTLQVRKFSSQKNQAIDECKKAICAVFEHRELQ
jgi:hypothetical protein